MTAPSGVALLDKRSSCVDGLRLLFVEKRREGSLTKKKSPDRFHEVFFGGPRGNPGLPP